MTRGEGRHGGDKRRLPDAPGPVMVGAGTEARVPFDDSRCSDREPHDPHEWYTQAFRRECPGVSR